MCQRADGGHGVSMPLVSIGHNQGVIQMEMTLLFITFGFVRLDNNPTRATSHEFL
jgi:hypothetical protein